jgi:hypothetical protein
MKINKLEKDMRGMFVEGKIVDISETRKINTKYGPRCARAGQTNATQT